VSATPRTLPDPILDPTDVIALVPGTSIEDATRCAQLATLALEAVLYPDAIPAPPIPPPMYAVTLALAGRLVNADKPVSESLGAYSYRDPAPVAPTALGWTEQELVVLEPWLPIGGVVNAYVGPEPPQPLPADAWQRNLEEVR
jgi:hypothetical protein